MPANSPIPHPDPNVEDAERAPRHPPLPLGLRRQVVEHLLTAQEVADRLGVSERWVRDHATRRFPRIRAVKLGSLLRFRWADVEAFLSDQVLECSSKKPVRGV